MRQRPDIGTVSGREAFHPEIPAEAGSRVIAFVQDDSGRVWGAGLLKLSAP